MDSYKSVIHSRGPTSAAEEAAVMITSRRCLKVNTGCLKVNTEERNLHALHSPAILPDSFRLLTCSSVAAYPEEKK